MKKSLLFQCCVAASLGIFAYSCNAVKSNQGSVVGVANDSASYWKDMITQNPGNLEAHQKYIKEVGVQEDNLVKQYDAWMVSFPKEPAIPLAIGTALSNKESPKAKPYLLKVVELDPNNAEAYMMLSIDAERWGDNIAAHNYMGRAAEADPENPSYAFYYSMDFEHIDPVEWRKRLYALAKRFPEHERGAQGLYWLATRSTDPAEKLRVYEMLKSNYPPQKFNWSASGMSSLYDIYLQEQPEKAVALAKELASSRGWEGKDSLAQNIIQVQDWLTNGKVAEAQQLAATLKAPRYSDIGNLIGRLKAQANDAAGNTFQAYSSLLQLQAKTPADELATDIQHYASKLGISPSEVQTAIQHLRDSAAYQAPPFTLGLYTSHDSVSLKDYKGKVVLLTFWFPGCGPCRGEFPHFESVIQKYSKDKVAYIGINVFPEQDEYVIPFMQGTKYSFTPLRGTAEWAKDVYKVRGQPTNFLIDKEGRVVFTDFRTDANNQRELELMINALL